MAAWVQTNVQEEMQTTSKRLKKICCGWMDLNITQNICREYTMTGWSLAHTQEMSKIRHVSGASQLRKQKIQKERYSGQAPNIVHNTCAKKQRYD